MTETQFDDTTRTDLTNADVATDDTVRVVCMNPETGEEFDVTGDVATTYADHKFAVEGDDGVVVILNDDTKEVREGSFADGFDTVEGFRPVFVEFATEGDRENVDADADDTLVYDNVVHGANESTGKEFTKTKTVEHTGEVYAEDGGVTAFRSPDFDGVFFVDDGGTVEYDPADEARDRYEVGTSGRIE
jgi:hypothetical protein